MRIPIVLCIAARAVQPLDYLLRSSRETHASVCGLLEHRQLALTGHTVCSSFTFKGSAASPLLRSFGSAPPGTIVFCDTSAFCRRSKDSNQRVATHLCHPSSRRAPLCIVSCSEDHLLNFGFSFPPFRQGQTTVALTQAAHSRSVSGGGQGSGYQLQGGSGTADDSDPLPSWYSEPLSAADKQYSKVSCWAVVCRACNAVHCLLSSCAYSYVGMASRIWVLGSNSWWYSLNASSFSSHVSQTQLSSSFIVLHPILQAAAAAAAVMFSLASS